MLEGSDVNQIQDERAKELIIQHRRRIWLRCCGYQGQFGPQLKAFVWVEYFAAHVSEPMTEDEAQLALDRHLPIPITVAIDTLQVP